LICTIACVQDVEIPDVCGRHISICGRCRRSCCGWAPPASIYIPRLQDATKHIIIWRNRSAVLIWKQVFFGCSCVTSSLGVVDLAWYSCTSRWIFPARPCCLSARHMQTQVVLLRIGNILKVVASSTIRHIWVAVVTALATSIEEGRLAVPTGMVLVKDVARPIITLGTNFHWLIAHHTIRPVSPSTSYLTIHIKDRVASRESLLPADQWLCARCPAGKAATGLRVAVEDCDLVIS